MKQSEGTGQPLTVESILKQNFTFELEITQACPVDIETSKKLAEHFATSLEFWTAQKSKAAVWNTIRNLRAQRALSFNAHRLDVS